MVIYFKTLKNAYKKALKNNEECFEINKKEILTKYAKYLIQNLENQGITKNIPIKLI